MSTQLSPRRRSSTRRAGSDVLKNSLPGIALVLASVLPSALSPSPAGGPAGISKQMAFQAGCKLPFDSIKTAGLTVDATCTENGNAGNDMGKRLESNAKNDFCVEGDPTPIVFEDFTNLQTASDKIAGLKKMLDKSRDPLSDIVSSKQGSQIGEGTFVQYVGFLFNAHFSNVGSGELVNCKLRAEQENDIHIELMKDSTEEDECQGVTAEMSPHFRPEAWNELVNLKTKNPVRITGPLFFDGSHHPCHDDVRPTPNRISVWEIHPVYQFEVCRAKSLKTCDVRDNSQWIPLDQFLSGDEEK